MNNAQKNSLMIGIAVVIIAVIAYAGLKSSSTNTIKIGFVGPLTGSPALWGNGARNMVALAVEDVNTHGGINGRQLDVTYEDGKCAAADAVSATQKLLASGIKFIVGGHCSPETAAMVPLTKDGKAFMIADITSADGAVSGSDYAFRTSPDTKSMAEVIGPIAIKRFKKIATITEQAAYAKSFTTDFEAKWAALGGTVVQHEEYKPGATDMRTELTRIKAAQPEAILLSPQSPATAIAILQQLHQLGLSVQLFGNTVLMAQEINDKSGSPAELHGAFGLLPYTDTKTGAAAQLAAAYKIRYNADVPYSFTYVAGAYDAVQMLANALRTCGEDTKCVADQFRSMQYDGAALSYRFLPNGDVAFHNWGLATFQQDGTLKVEALQ